MSVSLASRTRSQSRIRKKKRLSPAIAVLLLAAVAALGLLAFREWLAGRVTLTFERSGGAVPQLELTVFPDQLVFTTPSPPIALGTVQVDAGDAGTFDSDLVPGRAVVRYRGEGIGAGVVFVELGKELPPIDLLPPRTIRGRVGEPIGFWSFGWRCAGLRSVSGAEVMALAGGEHGIELAVTRADSEGLFELTGISPNVHPLSLRVRAPGYAITHVAVGHEVGDDVENPPLVAAVQPTTVLRGTIAAPDGIDLTKLCVLVRGLPGVQVYSARDGSFVLDHLPPTVEPRLIVHGLDAWHGCAEVRASRDADVHLEVLAAGVVRGRVRDGVTGEPLPMALVFAGDQPAVRSDEDGTFELLHVLPGSFDLTAQHRKKRPKRRDGPMRLGRTRIDLHGGETREGVVITVE